MNIDFLVDYVCNYCFDDSKSYGEIITNIGYLGYLLPILKIKPYFYKSKR